MKSEQSRAPVDPYRPKVDASNVAANHSVSKSGASQRTFTHLSTLGICTLATFAIAELNPVAAVRAESLAEVDQLQSLAVDTVSPQPMVAISAPEAFVTQEFAEIAPESLGGSLQSLEDNNQVAPVLAQEPSPVTFSEGVAATIPVAPFTAVAAGVEPVAPAFESVTPLDYSDDSAASLAPVSELSIETEVTDTPVASTPSALTSPVGEGAIAQQLPTQIAQAVSFPDVQGHWAQSFIEGLAGRDIIVGFPDGSFRPNAPVTRAQFAAMVRKAFRQSQVRSPITFVDVPVTYWAYTAIQEAYATGFVAGYPNNAFLPEQNIPRVQVLVSLASGLNLASQTETATVLNTYFRDAAQIPNYALNQVAAATENRIVVNYPNVATLNPNQAATRADVAAFIYQALVNAGELPPLSPTAIASQYIAGPEAIAQEPEPEEPVVTAPSPQEIQDVESRLQALQETRNFGQVFQGSPAITIATPSGFGADNNTLFISGTFQERTRYSNKADGLVGFGIGLGDAQTAVGVELAYTVASFGQNRDFGSGGFNAKIHRQLPDDFAVAVGWNGFATIGDTPDFKDSIYGTVSKVIRTRDDVNLPFSRVALNVGLGNGQFRSEDDFINDVDSINVFGSVAVRVAQPVSAIAEWTGQDLALGLSIVPIRNLNWVITPAFRDITGAGDGARFVLGTGISFQLR